MKGLVALATATAVTLGATAASLTATVTPAKADRWHYLIDQRLAEHGRLIDQGRAEGRFSPREMFFMRTDQREVRRTYAQARRDGALSTSERDALRQMQDAAAAAIFIYRNNDELGRPARPRPFAGLFY